MISLSKPDLLNHYTTHPRLGGLVNSVLVQLATRTCLSANDARITRTYLGSKDAIYQLRFCIWLISHRFKLKSITDANFRPFTLQSGTANDQLVNLLYKAISRKPSPGLFHQLNELDLYLQINQRDARHQLLNIYDEYDLDAFEPKDQTVDYLSQYPATDTKNESKKPTSRTEAKEIDLALLSIVEFLEQNNLPYFLASGSLLRLMRDGELPASDDIDIGIYIEDISPDELLKKVKDYSYTVISFDRPYVLNLLINGISVDLFYHFSEDNRIWHGSSYHRWYNNKFETINVDYLGHAYSIPDNWPHYLLENYGDWRTPVSEFSIYLDCPNYQPQYNLDAFVYFLKNYTHNRDSADKKTLSKLGQFLYNIKNNL